MEPLIVCAVKYAGSCRCSHGVFSLILISVLYRSLSPFPADSPTTSASVVWGIVTLMLCLIFMLGAAQTPIQFLVFFGMGVFGAGMGYLVRAWLTPSGESNPLDQARNIVAGVLTGVVGTNLLTLWDDLVDRPPGGGPPPIMTPTYFVPVVLWLVGFTVSLSAFYTVRSGQSGDVRVTYSPQSAVLQISSRHIGVLPETVVHFAGAANSPADVTASWDFHLEEPCGPPVSNAKPFNRVAFDKEMVNAVDTATEKLTTPAQAVLQDWINSCPGSQNWILTATSNQDRSKFYRLHMKFCRTKQDCPVTPAAAAPPAAGTTGAGGSATATVPTLPEPGAPAANIKQETGKGDNAKPPDKGK